MGVTKACLKEDGKTPSRKDKLARCAIKGAITAEHDLRRDVGTKSDGDDLQGILERSCSTSTAQTGDNLSNSGPLYDLKQGVAVPNDEAVTVDFITAILFAK